MAVKLVFLGRLEDVAGGGEREVPVALSLEVLLNSLEPDDRLPAPGERRLRWTAMFAC